MQNKYLAMLAGGLVAALAPAAMSACIYTLTTDAPTYNVAGGTATVHVYLSETLTSGSTSFLNEAGRGGLFSGELVIQRVSGDDAVISAVARNAAEFTDSMSYIHGPGAANWTAASSPTFVGIGNTADFAGTSGVMVSGGKIWMGDITLATGSGTNTASFTVDLPSNGGGYFASWDAYALDMDPASQSLPANAFVQITGSTFQVAVPEPGMLGLLAVSGLMLLRRR